MKIFNKKFLSFLLLQALIFMSCGKKDEPGTAAGRCDVRNAAGCAGAVAAQNNTDIVLQGLFWWSSQSEFQLAAAGLASATITANALGSVYNSDGGTPDNTGIAFGAKVSLSSGKPTTAPAGTAIAATSRLLVGIYDSFVGQQATSGQVIGPIQIPMTTATGTAGGGVANVTFNDAFGTIQFQGNYDATNFTGVVSFTNKIIVGGGAAVSGKFNFEIPTCSFFVCN